ncbi:MAG: hypothetical protein QF570_02475 [Myxococcota bacterium]|nr:hypothetical protein [Myxococcota bacterium]
MLIAKPPIMSIAKQLLDEIEAFAHRNPGHDESVGALVRAVHRIDTEFEGEVRTQLLEQARETFQRQVRTLENAEKTLDALEKLRENQKDLVEALKRLTVRRPEGATLH